MIEYVASEWSTGVVMAKKKGTTDKQYAVDYRGLNLELLGNSRGVPRIDDLFAAIVTRVTAARGLLVCLPFHAPAFLHKCTQTQQYMPGSADVEACLYLLMCGTKICFQTHE